MLLVVPILGAILVNECSGSVLYEDEKIVGGVVATVERFPYMINMYYNSSFRCGGAILSTMTILTAAHCTDGITADTMVIYAGSSTLGKGAARSVCQIIQNPEYNSTYITNDVSLLILEEPLILSNVIQPIGVGKSFVHGNVNAVASGWGLTSYPGNVSTALQYLPMRTVEHEKCQEIMLPLTIGPVNLCALGEGVGQGVCRGDSGGPLAADGKVIGVTSWSKEYCAKGSPDVFARVSYFSDWIEKHIV